MGGAVCQAQKVEQMLQVSFERLQVMSGSNGLAVLFKGQWWAEVTTVDEGSAPVPDCPLY